MVFTMAVITDGGYHTTDDGYSGWLLRRVVFTADGCHNGWCLLWTATATDGCYDGWVLQRIVLA
jgi:hypothetical protein